MPGVPRELAEHKLHIRPSSKPVKQPLRRFSEGKRRAIGEEVAKLLTAGFIMEVFYPEWLANPVLVLKKNKTWRMCIDYTCLNKACPKDSFALPRIDQVIDSMTGCELLSFLDATVGYHQIKLAVDDQIKNCIYHPFRGILLYHHAFWIEKWRGNLPAHNAALCSHAARSKHTCVCR